MRKNNIALNLQNIISFLKILTSHLTGVQKILTLCFIILSLTNITLCFQSGSVSALSYQTYQRLDFTFNPTIELTLSSSELTIPNLTPGGSSDSNIIDINVATNTFGGLNLTTTVGNSSNDTTSLVYRNNNTIIGSFDALSTTSATLEDIESNKYGYSYSVKGNDDTYGTYSSYAGLPKYDDTVSTPATLLSTTGTATSGAVKFKLGAKVSTTQPSGTYTNVINFTATTKPLTTTYAINYIDSTGEATPASLPAQATATIVEDTPVTISSTIPTRSGGYTFKSWCTTPTGNNTCTGNVYRPGDTYNISNIGEPVTINLYAMWQGPLLYDLVANQVKKDQSGNPRTQTPAELQAAITTPTSTNPAEDASNSGVYLYDSTTYGVASDASNDYSIYYFRGILDTENGLGAYGSDGQADAYPNYVKLNDTCWRIIRTTGSGGTKMIYNGLYSSGTTANSCANATTATRIETGGNIPFNYNNRQSVGVGYVYNNEYADNVANDVLIYNLFSINENIDNNASSSMKNYLDTWFSKTLDWYINIFENNAGYCGDRTVYINNVLQDENSTYMPQYTNSSPYRYYFGAIIRNLSRTSSRPSLSCPREAVDLYTTNDATSGNRLLSTPIALLAADEASLTGSGGYNPGSGPTYNGKSFLRDGSFTGFYLISPSYYENYSVVSLVTAAGKLSSNVGGSVAGGFGARPAISLIHSTTIASGSGTATDPWIISPPEN